MKSSNPLESYIEKKVCDYAKSLGCLVYKFTSPSRRSVPDRLFIGPLGNLFFVEFKRRGERPSLSQDVEIKRLQSRGMLVFVVDSVTTGQRIIEGAI